MDGTQRGRVNDRPKLAAKSRRAFTISPRVFTKTAFVWHGAEQELDRKSDGFRSDAVGMSGVSGKNDTVVELDVADEGPLRLLEFRFFRCCFSLSSNDCAALAYW